MKAIKNLSAAILALLMLLQGLPAFALDASSDFVNSDKEGFLDGWFYYAGNGADISYAYRETDIETNRQALTDYAVSSVAPFGSYVYVSDGSVLSRISLSDFEEESVYSSRAGIDGYAVAAGKVYMLINGSVFEMKNGEKALTTVVASGEINSFWLESAAALCYMTDLKTIYSLNLLTGSVTSKKNNSTDLGNEIPLYGGQTQQGSLSPDAMQLGSLQDKFPEGRYWNHIGSSNNPDRTTSTACTHHSSGCSYGGSCGCNSFGSAIQCMGYSFKCAYDVYGSYTSSWDQYDSSTLLDNVKAGDVIRYRKDTHSIFVTGVSGSTIYFTDCNNDGHCRIRWNGTVSKSTVASTFTYLRSAPYVAPGGGSASVEYTVTFNANGGSCSVNQAKIKGGDTYGDLPAPTREGYDFDGWFTSSSGGSLVSSGDKVTGSVTLYAHWTIKTYYVTFDKNGGNYAPDNFSKLYGESKVIANRTPSREGYTFVCWNTSIDGTGASYSPGATYSANETVTLYAFWKAKSVQIQYEANGGTVAEKYKTVFYDSAYGELLTPERTGYRFTGWHLNSESGELITADSIVKITSSQRIYASWEVMTYVVRYDANGGYNAPASQVKTYGRSLTLSSSQPSREHYSFLGWYTSATGSAARYSPGLSYTENADVTLYARWEGEKYTVSFNVNGGENAPSSVTKTHGTALTLPSSVPEKIGCSFVEWNTKQDGSGQGFKAGGSYNIEGSATLYAKWEVAKYTVVYITGGADNTPSPQVFEYNTGTVISSQQPTKTGFIFRGWFTAENGAGEEYGAGASYTENADLNLYAKWEREKYAVSFNAAGGSGAPGTVYKEYEIDLTLPSTVPSRSGYDFAGWKSASGSQVYNAGGVYSLNEPVLLYAQWTPATYTVVFDPNGADYDFTTAKFTYGSKYPSLPSLLWEGYQFLGWFTSKSGGSQIKEGATVSITSNSVFYARWRANTYSVSFDANGGECGVSGASVTFGSAFGSLPAPEKYGYLFAGWFDENGKEITAASVVSEPRDAVLTARWVKGVYSVTLDPEGGSVESAGITARYGEPVGRLPEPERTGYTFLGWADGGSNEFTPETLMPGENVTLHARWSAKTYEISFSGASLTAAQQSKKVSYGSPVGVLPVPSGSGEFVGWFTSSGEEITETTVYSYAENITVAPKFVSVTAGSVTFAASGEVVAVISNSLLPSGEPEIPQRAGFSASWGEYEIKTGGDVCKAVYTPETRTVTWRIGNETVTENYAVGSPVAAPELSAPEGSYISGFTPEIPAAMPCENLEITVLLEKITYAAVYVNEGAQWAVIPYTAESLPAARLPSKDGYGVSWSASEPEIGGMTVFAVYEPIDYVAVFIANGVTVAEITYNAETKSVRAPAVPERNGYTGAWQDYELRIGGITVNAVYTPNTYTVTFVADGKTVDAVSYVYGAQSVSEPSVPEKAGYAARWQSYTLSYNNLTVNALYTPIVYTATFVVNGAISIKVPFTVENPPTPPQIPPRSGYIAKWSDYTVTASDFTVTAKYIPVSEVYILGYVESRSIDYMTSITFRVRIVNAPAEYEVHWIINGVDMGAGNGDGTYTVTRATDDFTVSAYVYCDGESSEPSSVEKVTVRKSIFARITGFLRLIFGRLHEITQ